MSESFGDVDDLIGSGSEEAVYNKAYQEGFTDGLKEGNLEGWTAGLSTGSDVGFELGRYKGFALAAREALLNSGEKGETETPSVAAGLGDSSSTSKNVKLCDKIIKLVDEFKLENATSIHDACSQVRLQYNLLRSSLGIPEKSSPGEGEITGQKYSF